MRRRHLLLGALALFLALFAFYLVGPWTAVTIRSGTLDPAAITVGKTRYERVTEVTVRLLPRPYHVRVEQADYAPAKSLIWIAPWKGRVIELHPTLTAAGQKTHEVRTAAIRITEALGNYDAAKGFDAYLAKLKALTTPELYQDLTDNPSYLKGRASDLAVEAKAKTTVGRSELKSSDSEKALVITHAITSVTTKEGRATAKKKYTLTLKREGSAWKLAALHEETE